MSSITKYEKKIAALQAKVGKKKSDGGSKKKMGPVALGITRLGVQAISTLAADNYDTVGPIPVNPDFFITGVAGVIALFTKKNTQQFAIASFEGGLGSILTRLGRKKTVVHMDSEGKRTEVREETRSAA